MIRRRRKMHADTRFKGSTTKERSWVMSRIRSKDTGIEIALRRALWHSGIRFRKQYPIGFLKRRTIDIAVTKYKIAVFCDSEFFHGKDWPTLEKRVAVGNNPGYWTDKIRRNIVRDVETDCRLQARGWIVLRFWQRDIEHDIEGCVDAVREAIFERKTGE